MKIEDLKTGVKVWRCDPESIAVHECEFNYMHEDDLFFIDPEGMDCVSTYQYVKDNIFSTRKEALSALRQNLKDKLREVEGELGFVDSDRGRLYRAKRDARYIIDDPWKIKSNNHNYLLDGLKSLHDATVKFLEETR